MTAASALNRLLESLNLCLIRRSTLSILQKQLEISESQKKADPVLNEIGHIHNEIKELKTAIIQNQIATAWRITDHQESLAEFSPEITCPLCNFTADNSKFTRYSSHCVFGGGSLTRHGCPACDVIFGPRKMLALTSDELTQEYSTHYQVYAEGDSTAQEIRSFHQLSPKKSGVYLNFGAGSWSQSVVKLNSEGWKVFAYEPYSQSTSEFSISSASDLESMKFDGIFSNNVLEHFRNPVDELEKMTRLLKPSGLLSHTTPCFEYLYPITRFHLFFFLGRSRDLLASKANLRTVAFTADGEYMNLLLAEI